MKKIYSIYFLIAFVFLMTLPLGIPLNNTIKEEKVVGLCYTLFSTFASNGKCSSSISKNKRVFELDLEVLREIGMIS